MTAHRMNLSVRETMSLVAEPASGGGVQSQRTTSTPYWIPSFVSLSVREPAKSRQQKQRIALWITEEAMAWFVCSRAAGTLRRRRRPRRGMAGFYIIQYSQESLVLEVVMKFYSEVYTRSNVTKLVERFVPTCTCITV